MSNLDRNRKSNITIGYGKEPTPASNNTESYIKYDVPKTDKDSYSENKLALRKSYLSLGSSKPSYQTSQKEEFIPHRKGECARKPDSNPRAVHYKFGYAQGLDHYSTSQQRDYAAPQVDTYQPNSTSLARGTNIVFGSDRLEYQSLYQEQCQTCHDPKNQIKEPELDGPKETTKEKLNRLRKSHFDFGHDSQTYETTVGESIGAIDYNACKKNNDMPDFSKSIKKVNVNFGSMKVEYETNAASNFGGKADMFEAAKHRTILDAATKADLRKSHFTVGHDKVIPKSLTHETFVKKLADQIEAEKTRNEVANIRSGMRKTYLSVGTDPMTAATYTSTAKNAYNAKPVVFVPMNQQQKDDLRKVHWNHGTDTEDVAAVRKMSALHQDMQNAISGADYSVDHAMVQKVKEGRKTNIKLGEVTKLPESEARGNFVYYDYKKLQSAAMSKEAKADLRASHFKLGTETNSYKDIQSDYKSSLVDHGRAEPAFVKKVQPGISGFGTQTIDYATTNGCDFPWPGDDDGAIPAG